jgi:hypothetical protein
MSSLTDPLVGGGGTLVAAGGVLVGVGIAEEAGSHHSVSSDPWFSVGCALVALGLVLVFSTIVASWLRSRHPKRGPTIREHFEQGIPFPRGLGRGLGALIPDPVPSPPPSPLHLVVADESWKLLYNAVWAFGVAIRVTNLTEKPITLTHYYLQPLSGEGPRPPLAPQVWDAVNASTKRLKEEHASELFNGEITVPPLSTITRWMVHTSYLPLPGGGRPRCTFGMKDTLDNQYKFDIPARAAETYSS